MDKFSLVLQKMPMGVFAFIFLAILFILYFVLYIYISLNLKKICKIVFGDEKKYKLPLEPFDFLLMSFLPTTYWRELLSLKKIILLKGSYGRKLYFQINENQLMSLLKDLPGFFILQYLAIFSGILFMFLILASYYMEL